MTKLLHKLIFKQRQRRTIQYFRNYILQDEDVSENQKQEKKKQISTEKIWKDLQPQEDEWDHRLLYEVTGRKLFDSDFLGDNTSDSEEDDDDEDGTGNELMAQEKRGVKDSRVSRLSLFTFKSKNQQIEEEKEHHQFSIQNEGK